MTTNLLRLQSPHLRNSEYSIFVNQFAEIFLKYQPELLHLQKPFARLTALLPDLAKINSLEHSNVFSEKLHELDMERDALMTAFVSQVKTMGRLTLSSIAPHVAVLKRFLDLHGRDIAKSNYNSSTERTKNLLADYDAKNDVKAAGESLNLKSLFDQLRIVNSNFASLFMQRLQDEATAEKIDLRAIRNEADKVLTAFCNAFEFCSTEYDELDYATPAKELNDLIAYYKTQLKSRSTRRTASKEISKETPNAESKLEADLQSAS